MLNGQDSPKAIIISASRNSFKDLALPLMVNTDLLHCTPQRAQRKATGVWAWRPVGSSPVVEFSYARSGVTIVIARRMLPTGRQAHTPVDIDSQRPIAISIVRGKSIFIKKR